MISTKAIPPEVFKPQGGWLRLAQIHSSQYGKFVFAFYGGLEEIRLHFYFVKIDVSLGQALASNSPPDCCI